MKKLTVNLNFYLEGNPEADGDLDAIGKIILKTYQKAIEMTDALDALKTQVAAMETAEASAIALLQGLKKALDEAIANEDMEAIQAISDEIGADAKNLADAVAANTPAAEPAAEPAVEGTD